LRAKSAKSANREVGKVREVREVREVRNVARMIFASLYFFNLSFRGVLETADMMD